MIEYVKFSFWFFGSIVLLTLIEGFIAMFGLGNGIIESIGEIVGLNLWGLYGLLLYISLICFIIALIIMFIDWRKKNHKKSLI